MLFYKDFFYNNNVYLFRLSCYHEMVIPRMIGSHLEKVSVSLIFLWTLLLWKLLYFFFIIESKVEEK